MRLHILVGEGLVEMDDYRNVFGAMGDALLLIGRAPGEGFRVLDVNRAWERLFERSRARCLALPIERIFQSSLANEVAAACERCLAAGETIELHVQVPLATHLSTQAWRLSPVSEPGASTQRVVLLARPEAAEVESLPAIARVRNILEQTSDFIAHFDTEGRFLFLNAALLEQFGVSAADVLGKTGLDIWPEREGHEVLLEIVRTGEPREHEVFAHVPGKPPVWHQVRYAPERDEHGKVISIVAVGRDFTSLKLTEEKLRQSEQHFRALAEHSPDCILRFDRELRLVYANPALEHFAGAPLEKFIGKTVDELRTVRKPPYDETSVVSMRDALTRVLCEGAPLEFELCESGAHVPGGALYVNFVVVPEHDANGKIENILAIGRDVSPLKAIEAELRLLNETLEERVAARTRDLELANRDLKNFAHTVSHDLRAPLRAIMGFAALLKEEESAAFSERGRSSLDRLYAAGSRLSHLIDEILQYSYAGQATLARNTVAMESLAQDVVVELQGQYPHTSVTVESLPEVSGDATMLRQVLQNLIGNALKFSARQAHPRVEMNWLRQNGEIVFYVRDNGAGFDMSHADKLGGLFERLHSEREYPGNGVGLAIVQRLIERHGGRLWAKSQVGAGATFFFTVPNAAAEAPAGSGR